MLACLGASIAILVCCAKLKGPQSLISLDQVVREYSLLQVDQETG